MCTRLLYESGAGSFITARSMDWYEDLGSDLWFYPKGMKRDGGFGPGSVAWASTYGSVTLSGYDVGTADGMNEAGLVANLLYLAEADYAARQLRNGGRGRRGSDGGIFPDHRPCAAQWKSRGFASFAVRQQRRLSDL